MRMEVLERRDLLFFLIDNYISVHPRTPVQIELSVALVFVHVLSEALCIIDGILTKEKQVVSYVNSSSFALYYNYYVK
jgi:hypothetical protein